MIKKSLSVLWRYIIAIIVAAIVCGLSTMILKWSGVTMNGPSFGSRIIETIAYFVAFCAAVFMLFRKYGQGRPLESGAFLPLCAAAISVIRIVAAAFSSWSVLWFTTTGVSTLVEILFAGGSQLSSLTEIPRMYYLFALGLESVCFIAFSWIGRFLPKQS